MFKKAQVSCPTKNSQKLAFPCSSKCSKKSSSILSSKKLTKAYIPLFFKMFKKRLKSTVENHRIIGYLL
jgi:hypothetical protein